MTDQNTNTSSTGEIDLDAQDARAGATNQGVRYVLFWSLGGAVVALIIVAVILHMV